MEVPKLLYAYQELLKSQHLTKPQADTLKRLTLSKTPAILALASQLDSQPEKHLSPHFIAAVQHAVATQSTQSTDSLALQPSAASLATSTPNTAQGVTQQCSTTSHHANLHNNPNVLPPSNQAQQTTSSSSKNSSRRSSKTNNASAPAVGTSRITRSASKSMTESEAKELSSRVGAKGDTVPVEGHQANALLDAKRRQQDARAKREAKQAADAAAHA